MTEEPITIPVISDIRLADIEGLAAEHQRFGLELTTAKGRIALSFGGSTESLVVSGSHRLVSELLRLARFALLVREIAECRPADSVIDAVNQVHNELRSRP